MSVCKPMCTYPCMCVSMRKKKKQGVYVMGKECVFMCVCVVYVTVPHNVTSCTLRQLSFLPPFLLHIHTYLESLSYAKLLSLFVYVYVCVSSYLCRFFISLITKRYPSGSGISFWDQSATQYCLLLSWVIVLITIQRD